MIEAILALPLAELQDVEYLGCRTVDVRAALKLRTGLLSTIPRHRFRSVKAAESFVPSLAFPHRPGWAGPPPLLRDPARAGRVPYTEDEVFASLRLNGPNPVALLRVVEPDGPAVGLPWGSFVVELPISDADWRRVVEGAGPVLGVAAGAQEAVRQKRLFALDFRGQRGLGAGSFEGAPRHALAGPVACFYAHPAGKLVPVAIARGRNRLVFRGDPTWAAARLEVQVADVLDHQTRAHLGRVHCVVEQLLIFASDPSSGLMPGGLPRRFLGPFSRGVRMNMEMGRRSLLRASGGIAEEVLNADMNTISVLVRRAFEGWQVRDLDPEEDLRARGVDGPELEGYHYRTYARKLWSAIHCYVQRLLATRTDSELMQADGGERWVNLLRVYFPGRRGVGLECSRAGVERLVAGVAYLSSVGHSAVNYPQYDQTFVFPAFPAALYPPRPGATEPDASWELPRAAANQMAVLRLLSGRRFESILDLEPLPGGEAAHQAFRGDLLLIEEALKAELVARKHDYYYLLPSMVTSAANV